MLAHKNTEDKESVTLLANNSRATEIEKEKALERCVSCADNSAKGTEQKVKERKEKNVKKVCFQVKQSNVECA